MKRKASNKSTKLKLYSKINLASSQINELSEVLGLSCTTIRAALKFHTNSDVARLIRLEAKKLLQNEIEKI